MRFRPCLPAARSASTSAKSPTGPRNRRGTAISILDTGIGIQPDDLKRLFQPFFSTKSTKGTGLGLWISKGIIQKYDGTLTCRTFRGNQGNVTCFRVFLPVSGGFNVPTQPLAGGEPVRSEVELPTNHHAGIAL